jgi:DNA-binding response OmpR family regulator
VPTQRRILIAEPVSALRATWQSALAAMGFHVSETDDGSTALDIAMRSDVCLLITELDLPSGIDRCLIPAMRREAALRRVRILAVSSHVGGDDRAWALTGGADAYLAKPVRLGQLLQVTRTLTAVRRRMRDVS